MIHDGEPITYVAEVPDGVLIVRSFVSGGGDTEQHEVSKYATTFATSAGYGFLPASRSHSTLLTLDAEGSQWIRGHHRDNSEEARALLAAFKLVRSAA